MNDKEKKMIQDMIDKSIEKFTRDHRISSTSMIVDTPTDVNAVVNVQYLKDHGVIP